MKHLLILLVLLMATTSCEIPASSNRIAAEKTETLLKEASRQVGMPAIRNFQEKKIMKYIYELRDQEDMVCYAYLVNRNTGRVGQFLGKCIGYGIPYSTQFSNPEVAARGYYSLPQAEPNGLFMPEGLSATWLLLIDPKTNKPRPVYIEPEIIVSPFKLK